MQKKQEKTNLKDPNTRKASSGTPIWNSNLELYFMRERKYINSDCLDVINNYN